MSDTTDTKSQAAAGAVVAIDYLSKDWESFRRLMIERISSVAPDAVTGNPADPGTALVELLAYAADQVSQYQDAVATEAYLGTARLRTSVRRHARLLDYAVHDGANARAWVAIVVGTSADGKVLPAGTPLLSRVEGQPARLLPEDVAAVRARGAQVFETMHDVLLRTAHNRIPLYTEATDGPLLPAGTTSVALLGPQVQEVNSNSDSVLDSGADPVAAQTLTLSAGDVLVLEERPEDDSAAAVATRAVSGDPQRRHAVRLTSVDVSTVPGSTQQLVTVAWDPEDALPFALRRARTVAIGNLVLADHGYTLPVAERINTAGCRGGAAPRRSTRPLLSQGPLTFRSLLLINGQALPFDPAASASAAFPDSLRPGALVEPAIWLADDSGRPWSVRRDLLSSAAYARDFVVETEDDGRTYLRFGDGVFGRRPESDLLARYRIGCGKAGNVGAEALYHIASDLPDLLFARNPLPARGGVDPESIDHVRMHAPRRFHRQERAVTVEDYAQLVHAFPTVLDALVTRRFTGTYTTIVLTVLRADGAEADEEFVGRLRAYLDRYRMAGHELFIRGAVRVPLDIKLAIEVAAGHWRTAVLTAVAAALGTGTGVTTAPGTGKQRPGFFRQDRLALGQTVYLSQLITAAMQIPGVRAVWPLRFQRYGRTSALDQGAIELSQHEVAVVENLPGEPQHGRLEIVLQGGTSP